MRAFAGAAIAMSVIEWTAEESQAMDRWLTEERGFTIPQLMAVAGLRVAQAARRMLGAAADEGRPVERIVFLVGPGNNGGDALVAAEHLSPELPGEIVRPLAGDVLPPLAAGVLVIDGLFGVGLVRPIEGAARAAVEAVRASPARVLAVDVPSGLSADSGEVLGSSAAQPDGGVAVAAHATLTFVGPKRGFFRGRGPELVGRWTAVDIGFPVQEAEDWVRARRAGREGAGA